MPICSLVERLAVRLQVYMSVGLETLLSSGLRILTVHFEEPNCAKVCFGLLPFEEQYHSVLSLVKT
jgi:hypothetical protein